MPLLVTLWATRAAAGSWHAGSARAARRQEAGEYWRLRLDTALHHLPGKEPVGPARGAGRVQGAGEVEASVQPTTGRPPLEQPAKAAQSTISGVSDHAQHPTNILPPLRRPLPWPLPPPQVGGPGRMLRVGSGCTPQPRYSWRRPRAGDQLGVTSRRELDAAARPLVHTSKKDIPV